jgi:hypothetical protein
LYCLAAAVVFLLLGLLGFAAPSLAAALLASPPADIYTDNLLHLMTAIGLGYFGLQGSAAGPAKPNSKA